MWGWDSVTSDRCRCSSACPAEESATWPWRSPHEAPSARYALRLVGSPQKGKRALEVVYRALVLARGWEVSFGCIRPDLTGCFKAMNSGLRMSPMGRLHPVSIGWVREAQLQGLLLGDEPRKPAGMSRPKADISPSHWSSARRS